MLQDAGHTYAVPAFAPLPKPLPGLLRILEVA